MKKLLSLYMICTGIIGLYLWNAVLISVPDWSSPKFYNNSIIQHTLLMISVASALIPQLCALRWLWIVKFIWMAIAIPMCGFGSLAVMLSLRIYANNPTLSLVCLHLSVAFASFAAGWVLSLSFYYAGSTLPILCVMVTLGTTVAGILATVIYKVVSSFVPSKKVAIDIQLLPHYFTYGFFFLFSLLTLAFKYYLWYTNKFTVEENESKMNNNPFLTSDEKLVDTNYNMNINQKNDQNVSTNEYYQPDYPGRIMSMEEELKMGQSSYAPQKNSSFLTECEPATDNLTTQTQNYFENIADHSASNKVMPEIEKFETTEKFLTIFKKGFVELFVVTLTLLLTLMLFPQIGPYKWKNTSNGLKDSFVIIYQVGDSIGRILPLLHIKKICPTRWILIILTLARYAFLLIFLKACIINYVPALLVTIMLGFATTNGWLVSCAAYMLPLQYTIHSSAGRAAAFQNICILFGVTIGTYIGFPLSLFCKK